MSKEIILKYLTEFNAWVKGQEVYVMFNNGGHRLVDSLEDFNKDVKYIVLRDSYFPYRTALAEGKTVQYMNSNGEIKSLDDWDNIGWKKFKGCVENYRIKPEEPEFKVGDWITVNGPTGTFTECISGIADNTYTLSGTNICYKSQASKWEPKEGEVCIFWNNDSNTAVIAKLRYIVSTGTYRTEHSYWDNCMPFTGTLPPHMKVSK